ncbi:hypothetical protein Esti_002171 [Eimeria stiedai]
MGFAYTVFSAYFGRWRHSAVRLHIKSDNKRRSNLKVATYCQGNLIAQLPAAALTTEPADSTHDLPVFHATFAQVVDGALGNPVARVILNRKISVDVLEGSVTEKKERDLSFLPPPSGGGEAPVVQAGRHADPQNYDFSAAPQPSAILRENQARKGSLTIAIQPLTSLDTGSLIVPASDREENAIASLVLLMEPAGHECTARPCSFWRLRFRAVLWGNVFLAIFVETTNHALAFPQQANVPTVQQQPADALGMRSLSLSPSVSAMPSVIVDGPSRSKKQEGQGGETLEKLGPSGQQRSAILASEGDARKLQTLPLSAPLESERQGLGDKQRNAVQKLSEALKVEEAVEEPLTVAERVRRRFHSQKLFQEDEENDNSPALDPLPKAVVEEMFKEAQMESTSTNSTTKVVCLSNCSMHGLCTPYGCSCAPGWGGVDCSSRSCPKNCSGNGVCVDGKCKCSNGFLGEDCSESDNYESEAGECPNDCSGNGICDPFTRQCTCKEGFIGRSCGEERCPNDCAPNGQCADSGRCRCKLGYGGSDCSEEICPNSCSGLGVCSSIGCLCYEGSGGVDCSQPQKTNLATPFGCASDADCSMRGSCEAGRCICNTGRPLELRALEHNSGGFEGDCSELARDIFSAVCKHSSSLYVLAFDTNIQPDIKTCTLRA